MSGRYPGYDVLSKRNSPSWNEQTRRVIDQRLSISHEPRFFTAEEFATLDAICGRVIPQPSSRPPVPVAALVDRKLFEHHGDGYRDHRLPPADEAWRRGLRALDAEAAAAHATRFADLAAAEQDALLRAAQNGELKNDAWQAMDCALFFAKRVLFDIVAAYYGHPTAWSEIGFGGPAGPRGYVRMDYDRRDPWEAAEASAGDEIRTMHANARVG